MTTSFTTRAGAKNDATADPMTLRDRPNLLRGAR